MSNSASPRFTRHFLFWLFWWVFQGIIYGFFYTQSRGAAGLLISFGDSLIFLTQHMLLSYGLMYYVVPVIMQELYGRGLLMTATFILLSAFSSALLNDTLIKAFHDFMNVDPKNVSMFHSFMGGLRGSLTVAGFAVTIKLLKHWYITKMEKQTLVKENTAAQLQVLKNQLHPHFMFNTLNSIYALSLKRSERTPDAILQLSQLMRYMLVESNHDTVPLRKEVDMLLDYIELEKTRLGDRLDLSLNIEGDLNGQSIAPLLLLPYLENSFKFGAHESLDQAWISIDLQAKDDGLHLKVMNSKPERVSFPIESFHLGLDIARKRLRLLYPEKHELKITNDDGLFIVSLHIQLDNISLAALV